MKLFQYFFIINFLLLSISCGKDTSETTPAASIDSNTLSGPLYEDCSMSKFLGRWRSTAGSIFMLTPDCRYTHSGCGSYGQFPNMDSNYGKIQITVDAVARNVPDQCLPLGIRDCYYQYDEKNKYLTVNCSNDLVGQFYRETN